MYVCMYAYVCMHELCLNACMYVCVYVCMHVCLFLEDFLGLRVLTEAKAVSYDRFVNNTLLGYALSAVRFQATAWQVIVIPIGLTSWSG